jgi:hypothetical protein
MTLQGDLSCWLAGWHTATTEKSAVRSNIGPIPVRMRRRNDQERNRLGRLVHELMLRSGRNLERLTCPELESRTIHLEDGLSLQNVKELPRPRVKVAAFSVSRWHTLLDHAELRSTEQMPAFAPSAPLIPLA